MYNVPSIGCIIGFLVVGSFIQRNGYTFTSFHAAGSVAVGSVAVGSVAVGSVADATTPHKYMC